MKTRILFLTITSIGLIAFFCKGEIRTAIRQIPHMISSCSTPPTKDYHGIDVSRHQKKINWSEVAKDKEIQFVYIKATEGATYQDPLYDRNIEGARKNGFKVGAYHYFRTTSSAHKQFENFKKHAKKADQDLIPIVDVEERKHWTRSQFQDSLKVFIRLVKDHYGKAPIIYSVNSFYNKHCAPEFNNYHLMIGRYNSDPTKVPTIKGVGTYTIWQYSESGRVKGIPEPVDLNRFHPNRSIKDLLLK